MLWRPPPACPGWLVDFLLIISIDTFWASIVRLEFKSSLQLTLLY